MTLRYNPSNPTIVGSEWFASATFQQTLTDNGLGTRVVSTATESIDTIYPWIDAPDRFVAFPNLQCDIYDMATISGLPGWPDSDLPYTRRYIKPAANSPATQEPSWAKVTSGTPSALDSNNWQQVDDSALSDADAVTVGASDTLRYTPQNSQPQQLSFKGGSTFLDGGTGLSTANLSGLRIASLEVVINVKSTMQPALGKIAGFLNIDGIDYVGTYQTMPATGIANVRRRWRFDLDPRTGLPWTNTAAQTFVSVATNYFGVSVKGNPGTGYADIEAMGLMFHTAPERRVAVATGPLLTTSGWQPLTCQNPGTGATASWTKTTAHDFLLVFSCPIGPGSGGAKMRYLNTSTVSGHENDFSLFVRQYVGHGYGGVPNVLINPTADNVAVLLVVSGVASDDSQPYATSRADEIGGAADQKLRQNFGLNIGLASYATASMVLKTTGTGGVAAQEQPLSVVLKRTSDNVTLAGPFSLAASFVPPDGKWHVVTVRFALAASLTTSSAVYLELSSTGSTHPWFAAGLLTRVPPIAAADPISIVAGHAGISGNTLNGTIGGVADVTLDYPWNIGTSPAAPTGFASSVLTKANQPTLTGPARVATIPYVHLTWTATSLSGSFGAYELQRFEKGPADWRTIAFITLESSNYFNDFETIRNSVVDQAVYRLRVVRADTQPSDWVLLTPFTPVITTSECALFLASNWDPDLTLAFQDETPYEFGTNEAGSVVTQRIANREFPVQFQAVDEGLGDQFVRKLIVAANDPSVTGTNAGRIVFDPLVALTRAAVPYIAVADGWGRRWLCGVKLGVMSRTEAGGHYMAQLQFTEVANEPVPVSVDVPWH